MYSMDRRNKTGHVYMTLVQSVKVQAGRKEMAHIVYTESPALVLDVLLGVIDD